MAREKHFRSGGRMRIGFLTSFVLTAVFARALLANQVCHIKLEGCPESFDGITVEVPMDAVAIHREIRICEPEVAFQGKARVPASIVFVIDDSPSMATINESTGNDQDGNRYRVTKEVLDKIYAQSPETRVGVVAFRNWLAWDWQTNPVFEKIDESGFTWNDSYFPLTRLDTTFSDNSSGLEKIKSLFTTDQWNLLEAFQTNDSTERTRPVDPGTGKPYLKHQQGTDITLAFMAAKDALEDSPTPKERQFIIFLSDGLHGRVDQEMEARKTEYIEGDEVPTTFTVFLGDNVKTPPSQLTQMMNNIKNSGYTSANSQSQLWSIATSHDALLNLMQEAILTRVFRAEVKPISGSLSDESTQTTTDSTVIFSRFIPLEPDTTPVHFQAQFAYVDTAGVADVSQGDTIVSTDFQVVRNPNVTWDLPAGITKVCYTREIILVSHGDTITGTLNNKHDTITVYMKLEGLTEEIPVALTVSNAAGDDQVQVPLVYSQGTFSGTFYRQTGSTPNISDGTLQHALLDTATFLWTNPDVPLDVIRDSRQIVAYDPVTIESSTYLDTDGDGYIDRIRVKTSPVFNPREIDSLTADRFSFPTDRDLTFESVQMLADSSGFDIMVYQNRNISLNTAIDPGRDSLVILRHEVGPYQHYIEKGSYPISDGMAPVIESASYRVNADTLENDTLVVQFSERVPSINTSEPFTFTDQNGITYTMVLRNGPQGRSSYTFEVLSTSLDGELPATGDTVRVASPGTLRDAQGNIQGETDKHALLEVVYPPFDAKAFASPNPFTIGAPGNITVPGMGTVSSGTIVVLQVTHPQDSAAARIDESRTRGTIYDAVGNMVAENLRSSLEGSNYYFHWDGRNHNDRLVGSGTYLGIFTITYTETNRTEVKRVKIGARRK